MTSSTFWVNIVIFISFGKVWVYFEHGRDVHHWEPEGRLFQVSSKKIIEDFDFLGCIPCTISSPNLCIRPSDWRLDDKNNTDSLLGELSHSLTLSLWSLWGCQLPYCETALWKNYIKRARPASNHVNELGSGYPKVEPSEETAALVDSLNAALWWTLYL